MAKKETHAPATGAQGTIGGGRFYRPPSVAPKDEKAPEGVGPEGRFYVPGEGDKAGESVAENPVEQAGVMAGEPPTSEEVKAAKVEAEAAEKAPDGATPPVGDPAAQTGQPEPIAAAAEQAGDPPTAEEVKVAKAAQKAEDTAAKKATAAPAKKAAAKKSTGS